MGLRFRRSVKIAPGLRLNFNKNSMGLTLGPRGAHYTVNTKGRVSTSVGLPGTGIYYTESYNKNAKPRTTRTSKATPKEELIASAHWDQPNLLSGPAERAFYEFAETYLAKDSKKSFTELKTEADRLRTKYPEITSFIDYLMIAPTSNEDANAALALCEKIWALGNSFLDQRIPTRYFDQFQAAIPIARGIYFHTNYNHSYLTYTYSELLQATGNPAKALEILNSAPESEYKEIAVLDLYLSLKQYEDVIAQTNNITNTDDNSALTLLFRAIAFRETNQPQIAIETFRLVTSKRSRSQEILNYAIYERACTYEAMGKKAMAIKDLNKLLAVDSTDEAAQEKLKEITQ